MRGAYADEYGLGDTHLDNPQPNADGQKATLLQSHPQFSLCVRALISSVQVDNHVWARSQNVAEGGCSHVIKGLVGILKIG